MIRCPNCKQSFHAYMRGGAFIKVSLDSSYLLVDTNAEMKTPDPLNPDALDKNSALICPQCGEVADAPAWKDAWKYSSFKQRYCRCGGELMNDICQNCHHRADDLYEKYPQIKVDYSKLTNYLRTKFGGSSKKPHGFGWSDYE